MDHEPVQAFRKHAVCKRLEIGRGTLVCSQTVPLTDPSVHGEGFCGADVLTVDVGHRGRFPYVSFSGRIGRVSSFIGGMDPHRRHRDVCLAFRHHPVTDKGFAPFMRFGVPGHPVSGQYVVDKVIMILCNQFPKRGPPVEKELLALFGTFEYHSGQDGHPWPEVITPPGPEFILHIHSPCSFPGLVTVYHQAVDGFPQPSSGCFLVKSEIMVVISPYSGTVQFIYFQSSRFR